MFQPFKMEQTNKKGSGRTGYLLADLPVLRSTPRHLRYDCGHSFHACLSTPPILAGYVSGEPLSQFQPIRYGVCIPADFSAKDRAGLAPAAIASGRSLWLATNPRVYTPRTIADYPLPILAHFEKEWLGPCPSLRATLYRLALQYVNAKKRKNLERIAMASRIPTKTKGKNFLKI